MANLLDGKNALVTGAGRNIGRAISLALAQAGANIGVNVRSNVDEGSAVAADAKAMGVGACVLPADVSDHAAVKSMFQDFRSALGPVHVLVNNAAIRPRQAFLDIGPDDLANVLGVNLSGPFYCCQEAVRDMRSSGWGRIVNVSGVDAFVGSVGRAHVVATKAGIIGLTRALALEFGNEGLTANAVVPGVFDTSRPIDDYPGWDREQHASETAVGRIGDPRELGETVLSIVSSPFMNGQAIHLNGGLYFG